MEVIGEIGSEMIKDLALSTNLNNLGNGTITNQNDFKNLAEMSWSVLKSLDFMQLIKIKQLTTRLVKQELNFYRKENGRNLQSWL